MPKPATIRASQRQEKEVADTLGGKVTPQSGAGWAVKNDVRTDEIHVECKTTLNNKQITIRARDIEDVMGNALKSGRVGILTFRLHGRDYVVSEMDDWVEQYQRASGNTQER